MTSYYFKEEHQLFRQTLRQFLGREVLPFVDEWEEKGEVPQDLWAKFGEMGYFGLDYDEKYGGLGADFFYTVVFLEEISKCNSAGFGAAISAHPYLACSHLNNAGSDYLKERYLIPGIKGEKIGCLAVTEPSGGSDVAAIKTTAKREGDHYILNGSKTFITNGVSSDFLVVAAKTQPEKKAAGMSLLVVDRETEGLSATKLKKLGWNASDTGEIGFDEVKVPAENLLGQEGMGFYYIMNRFAQERLIMAISAVAAADDALQYALEYMEQRKAFGRPINKFQVLRHRVAELSSRLEAARYFVYNICRAFDAGEYLVKECAMAKLLTTELCDEITYACIQFLGGYGYMEEYKAARMWRDSRLGTIGGGTSEIMREIIAKMTIDEVKY